MLISFNKLINKYNLKIRGVSHFGAHKGQEVKSYLENGITNIHLFEPQRNAYELLSYKFKDVGEVNLYNFGLVCVQVFQVTCFMGVPFKL